MNIDEKLEKYELMKKGFMYYAGEWHNSDCPFIFHDQGVCNCNHTVIKNYIYKLIKSLIKEVGLEVIQTKITTSEYGDVKLIDVQEIQRQKLKEILGE